MSGISINIEIRSIEGFGYRETDSSMRNHRKAITNNYNLDHLIVNNYDDYMIHLCMRDYSLKVIDKVITLTIKDDINLHRVFYYCNGKHKEADINVVTTIEKFNINNLEHNLNMKR